jgi:membrane-associated phospholipid phosphatase
MNTTMTVTDNDARPVLPPAPGLRRRVAQVGLLLFLGVALVMAVMPADEPLLAMRNLTPDALFLANFVSRMADHRYLLPGGALLALVLFRVRRPRAGRLVLVMLLGSLLAGLSGTLLRSVVGRTRPESGVQQGWYGPRKDGRWIIGRHAYAAFPSGHTSSAAGLGLILFGVGRTAGLAGLAYALLVGWGRVMLGAHRPSDIAAGLVVGAITALLLWPKVRAWTETGPTSSAPAAAG